MATGLVMPPMGGMIQNPTGTQGQLSAYPTNPVAGIAQGMSAFVNNYLGQQEAVQQHYKNQFMQGIQAKMLGLPVDDEQIMKWAKKGGIPIRTDPYTPEEKQYQQQKSQQDQAWAQLMQGSQGSMSPEKMQQASQLAAGPIPTAPAPPQRPGFFGRLAQGMGFNRGPVSTDSPAGDWMRSLSSAVGQGGGLPGQVARGGQASVLQQKLLEKGFDVQNMSMDQQMQLMNLTKAAYAGDSKAMELIERSGIFKELPGDDIARAYQMADPTADPSVVRQRTGEMLLWMQGGGPQMRMYMMGLAKDMLPRFGGNMGAALQYSMNPWDPNSPQPQRTPEEVGKLGEVAAKIMEAVPNIPPNLAYQRAEAELNPGNTALKDALDGVINGNYKTKGAVQQQQFGVEQGIKAYEAQTGRAKIPIEQQDADSMTARVAVERGQLELAKVKSIVENAGEQGEQAWKIINDKDATLAQRNDAYEILANSIDKKAQLKVNYGGKDFTLADPVQTLDDWKMGSAHTWFTGQTGLSPTRMKPGAFSQPLPPGFDPQTFGSHPGQQKILNSLRGLSQDEASTVLKRSGIQPPPPGMGANSYSDMIKLLMANPPQ